uniref:Uncharacterized protein n=1 Tax=Romanomermis culicivorax TaxID=13658 RepID=A0A915JNT8_ROMCU
MGVGTSQKPKTVKIQKIWRCTGQLNIKPTEVQKPDKRSVDVTKRKQNDWYLEKSKRAGRSDKINWASLKGFSWEHTYREQKHDGEDCKTKKVLYIFGTCAKSPKTSNFPTQKTHQPKNPMIKIEEKIEIFEFGV